MRRRYISLLPGVYVWFGTVASVAFILSDSSPGKVSASLAGLCLLVSTYPVPPAHSPRRLLGTYGFIACSLATWTFCRGTLHPTQFDTGHMALGGLGWSLFAIGAVNRPSPVSAMGLQPLPPSGRRKPAATGVWSADLAFVTVVLLALSPLYFAWDIVGQPQATLAHVMACGAALSGFALAPAVSASFDQRSARASALSRLAGARGWLVLLAILLALGVALKVF